MSQSALTQFPDSSFSIYLSPKPSTLPPRSLRGGGGLAALPLLELSLPSAASRSRNSCHISAKDSLLLELEAANIGSESDGVEGVRRKGDEGRRRLDMPDAPGRARPACSRCSMRS
jgi:hypothetical protein